MSENFGTLQSLQLTNWAVQPWKMIRDFEISDSGSREIIFPMSVEAKVLISNIFAFAFAKSRCLNDAA